MQLINKGKVRYATNFFHLDEEEPKMPKHIIIRRRWETRNYVAI